MRVRAATADRLQYRAHGTDVSIDADRRATRGERFTYSLLEHLLPEDAVAWFEPILPGPLRPDFLILAPSHGLLVLEVKDWNPRSIWKADRQTVTILGDKEVSKEIPLETARTYMYAAPDRVRSRGAMHQTSGTHRGKVPVPFGWGVILRNFKEPDSKGLGTVFHGTRRFSEVISGGRASDARSCLRSGPLRRGRE